MKTLLAGRALLLFSEVFLIWQSANYLGEPLVKRQVSPKDGQTVATRDHKIGWWLRIVLGAILAAYVTFAAAAGNSRLWLSLFVLGLSIVLPILRRFVIPQKYLAELEIVTGVFFSCGAFWWIGRSGLTSTWTFQLQPLRLAAYSQVAGLLVFICEGGSLIVVGILARGGTIAPSEGSQADSSNAPDQMELRHGQIIGKIERLTLALLIANGQFQSMAFFFAAKGLIRSKELERRAWADYLLLGSLTSFLIALIAGLVMNRVLQWS